MLIASRLLLMLAFLLMALYALETIFTQTAVSPEELAAIRYRTFSYLGIAIVLGIVSGVLAGIHKLGKKKN